MRKKSARPPTVVFSVPPWKQPRSAVTARKMSGGYADRLKHYPNKGVCGLPENYDSERLLKTNLRALVELVRDAKHLVILTGAGISTSAGIPDFRGPNGIWTVQKVKDQEAKHERKRVKRVREEVAHSKKPRSSRATKVAEQVAQLRAVVGEGASDAHLEYLLAQARGRVDEAVNAYYDAANAAARASAPQAVDAAAAGSTGAASGATSDSGGCGGAGAEPSLSANGAVATNAKMAAGAIDFSTAAPTLTHLALVELVRRGKVHFVVTQNVDGLDQRAGLPREKLAVLHGCIFEEKCEDCGRIFLTDTDVGSISFTPTGRQCAACNGVLRDTLLDWEDPLPEDELDKSEDHCRRAARTARTHARPVLSQHPLCAPLRPLCALSAPSLQPPPPPHYAGVPTSCSPSAHHSASSRRARCRSLATSSASSTCRRLPRTARLPSSCARRSTSSWKRSCARPWG